MKLVKNDEFWAGLRKRLKIRHGEVESRLAMISNIKKAKPLGLQCEVNDQNVTIKSSKNDLRRSMTNLNISQSRLRKDNKNTEDDDKSKIRRCTSIMSFYNDDKVFLRRNTALSSSPEPFQDRGNDDMIEYKRRSTFLACETVGGLGQGKRLGGLVSPLKGDLLRIPRKGTMESPISIPEEDLEVSMDFKKLPITTKHTKTSSSLSREMEFQASFLSTTKATESKIITPMSFTERFSKISSLSSSPRVQSFKSPLGSLRENTKGMAAYSMNSFPIYLALWSPCN